MNLKTLSVFLAVLRKIPHAFITLCTVDQSNAINASAARPLSHHDKNILKD